MVKGLQLFTDYFRDFNESYILIGGAATDIWLDEVSLPFRVTKDLDIILVVEALSEDFVKHFWKFIEEGKYEIQQRSDGTPRVYRFIKPGQEDYPFQVEIFSRKPDISGDFDKAHLVPIPLGEDLSSLSAILMNEVYYSLVKSNSEDFDGLHLAKPAALICLKAKAFLDIKQRLDNKDWANGNEKSNLERDYKKHRNDIIRTTLILTEKDKIKLEDPLKEDIQKFIEFAQADPPDYKILAGNFEVEKIEPEEIFKQLHETFEL